MFSKIIRFGVAMSGAAILSSCGGSSGQTVTQQSTPEGLFSGSNYTVSFSNTAATPPTGCTQNALIFVEYTGVFYSFILAPAGTIPGNPADVISASSGSLSFSAGTLSSGNIIEVTPPNVINVTATSPFGTNCGIPIINSTINDTSVDNEATSPSLTGGYSTGINLAGTFNYPVEIDALGDFKSSIFNINYDPDYQGVQSLATLAGTYTGTVATSQLSETATFSFGPASVPANSGNQFGVGIVSGTGASGCVYNGTVSPLFKGNGYNLQLSSGGSPCLLPNTQFSGLVYLNTTTGNLYSFSPNLARTDGLIFTGQRN